MDKKTIEDGKAMAIVSYIGLIGIVIAFILNNDKKNEFTKYHMRQSILITIGSLFVWIPILGQLLGLFLLVVWIIALISAINGEVKEAPVIGKYAQEWFKGL